MNRLLSRSYIMFSIFAFGLALVGCGSKVEQINPKPVTLPVAQVRVQTLETKSRPLTEEVAGTLRAKWRVTLEAKLSGRIENMPVRLGEKLEKGQLVAKLDAGEIVGRLEQAEASLEQANRDFKRITALFEQTTATRAEYDSAQTRVRTAGGAVAEARATLTYVEIVAPFRGVVTKKWLEMGDLAEPGKPLVEIEDPTSLQLDAAVPESIASYIQPGRRCRVHVDATASEIEGVVSEVSAAADTLSRTFQVKLDLPRTEGLKSGQFARLLVAVGERNSLRVPISAVVQRGQLEMIFSVMNQRAQLHLVKTGKRIGEEIEILSGIDAGKTVVVSGAEQLSDGQPVQPQ